MHRPVVDILMACMHEVFDVMLKEYNIIVQIYFPSCLKSERNKTLGQILVSPEIWNQIKHQILVIQCARYNIAHQKPRK